MHMGRERGVMRWDARHWILSDRLDQVESRLTRLSAIATPAADTPTPPTDAAPRMRAPREERAIREEVARLTTEREDLRRRLRALGPSPRAKMG